MVKITALFFRQTLGECAHEWKKLIHGGMTLSTTPDGGSSEKFAEGPFLTNTAVFKHGFSFPFHISKGSITI